MKVLHAHLPGAGASACGPRGGVGRPPAPALEIDFLLVLRIDRLALDTVELQKVVNLRHENSPCLGWWWCSGAVEIDQCVTQEQQTEMLRSPLVESDRPSATREVEVDRTRNGRSVERHYFAGAGRSATNRIDIDSSSSWKWGRRNATARYTPGFPGTSTTSTRASFSGFLAFIAKPTSSLATV